MKINIDDLGMIQKDKKNCGKWKIELSGIFSWVRIILSDQSEYKEHYWKTNSAAASNGVTLWLNDNY